LNLWSTRALFVRTTAGAIGIRLSLRPLLSRRVKLLQTSGASRTARMRSRISTSLRANGSRERAPDDRLREAIHSFFVSRYGLLRFARNDVFSCLKFESDVSVGHREERRPSLPKLCERRRKQSMSQQAERWIASLTLAMTTRGKPGATPPSPAQCCRTRRGDRRAAASPGWRREMPAAPLRFCRLAQNRPWR
jgi:hypothetical protein